MSEIILFRTDGSEIARSEYESVRVAAGTHKANLVGANLVGANLAGAKNLVTYHDCAAEILRRAAVTDEQERWAAWPLLRHDWCWDVWLEKMSGAPEDIQTWVRSTLCADPAWGFKEKFKETTHG